MSKTTKCHCESFYSGIRNGIYFLIERELMKNHYLRMQFLVFRHQLFFGLFMRGVKLAGFHRADLSTL
jgi:hypothetical protein